MAEVTAKLKGRKEGRGEGSFSIKINLVVMILLI